MELINQDSQLHEPVAERPETLADLAVSGEQAEEVKGGPQCSNNLKQLGLAAH